MSYHKILDLIILAQNGDKAAIERLLYIYEPKIQQIARNALHYLIGYEFSDIIQEARISFWEAILVYDYKRKTNFEYFARCCIRKQLISKMKSASKRRNKPLNEGESLSNPIDSSDPDGLTEYDMIPDKTVNIEKDIISQHEVHWLDEHLKKRLTELERDTYSRYNDGYTYREIAVELQRTEKTIDNAIMRVRNKAKDVAKQYITTILVKDKQSNIDEIVNQYGAENVDEMISSFYNGIFNLDDKPKKERRKNAKGDRRKNHSKDVS